jgi:hypothetical protein
MVVCNTRRHIGAVNPRVENVAGDEIDVVELAAWDADAREPLAVEVPYDMLAGRVFHRLTC